MKSVERKIGQLLMVGLQGKSLRLQEKAFLKRVRPAGVIYFRRNIQTPAQIKRLSSDVRKTLGRSYPPFIGIDQEGGRVARLSDPFTEFPGNDYLGRVYLRTGSTRWAILQAKAMATELRSVGINLNFTPVADIHPNPRNPIIGPRAFGSDPLVVSALVSATVRAYRQAGVISCAKHFPGHGDTYSDSHLVLPTVNKGIRLLRKREMLPFHSAIKASVPTIMTAHVIYRKLDPRNPATLSPRIIQDELRRRLGYRGVVVSDDLEMNAIARHQNLGDAAVSAIESGVDLLLVCKSLDEADNVYDSLIRAAQASSRFRKRILESERRIHHLKKKYLKGRQFGKGRKMRWPKHQRIAQAIRGAGYP